MALRWNHDPTDSTARRVGQDGQPQGSTDGNPAGSAVFALVSCGPIALVALPTLWWVGYTFLQAALLTIGLQLLVFLVLMMIGFYRTSGDAGASVSSQRIRDTPMEDLQVWRSYSYSREEDDALRIALIARNTVQTRRIATDLAQQGYDIHHTTDIDAMFETVQTHPVDWDFIIFDLDLFDDLDACVDELMAFRLDCADIPVLLLSQSVKQDELSDHRRAIGDATLRKPVFRSRLLAGIDAMKSNFKAGESV